jgi:hypothetical protein
MHGFPGSCDASDGTAPDASRIVPGTAIRAA